MKYNFPSIVHLLDIMSIAPYLIKYGILEIDELCNEYSSATSMTYSQQIVKLMSKLQKHPQEFMMALEESAKNEPHSDHMELLVKLQHHLNSSQQVRVS